MSGNGPGGGQPWCLSLPDRVLLVAVYYRTNLAMRQFAPLFGISPATVCRDELPGPPADLFFARIPVRPRAPYLHVAMGS